MRKALETLSIIFFVILCAGCSQNDPSVNATRLRIKLADAPTLILKELNIEIERIEVSLIEASGDEEKWISLDFKGGIYNVLGLSNGKSKQIVDQYFRVGVLRRIKIVFGTGSNILRAPTETQNEDRIPLVLDPAIAEGIVLEVNADLYANYVSSIVIDVNALSSIRESNGNYIFNPSVRVFAETFGGSLKGYVLPDEAAPYVIVAKDADTIYSIPEKADGMFLFKGLEEGEWKIRVLPTSGSGYRDTVFTDSVFAGKIRELKSKIVLKKIN